MPLPISTDTDFTKQVMLGWHVVVVVVVVIQPLARNGTWRKVMEPQESEKNSRPEPKVGPHNGL